MILVFLSPGELLFVCLLLFLFLFVNTYFCYIVCTAHLSSTHSQCRLVAISCEQSLALDESFLHGGARRVFASLGPIVARCDHLVRLLPAVEFRRVDSFVTRRFGGICGIVAKVYYLLYITYKFVLLLIVMIVAFLVN